MIKQGIIIILSIGRMTEFAARPPFPEKKIYSGALKPFEEL
jgi:hypothetical protein